MQLWELVFQGSIRFGEVGGMRLAAGFSFFAMLSLAPALVFAVVIAGSFFGERATTETFLREASEVVGEAGAELLSELVTQARRPAASTTASILSLLIVFFGASNLFMALNEAVMAIWGYRSKHLPWVNFLLTRVYALVGALAFGGVVLLWLVLEFALEWAQGQRWIVGENLFVARSTSFVFLFAVCALLFKSITPTNLAWRDVLLPALISALLLTLIRALLGYYFKLANTETVYGSAGALVVLLLWIYYAAQAVFFGFALTYIQATRFGSARGFQDL
jgi:membrane protein